MSVDLTFSRLAGDAGSARLAVVGPSLGTAVEPLWRPVAELHTDTEVIGWDLPGHGRSRPTEQPFSVEDLADAVRAFAAQRAGGRPAVYAGVSLGGAVALELALDPGIFARSVCIASAAKIGIAADWRERALLVRRAGTPAMVAGSAQRWFAPGFIDRDPVTASALLHSLSRTDDESYALACEALADFDVRRRLGEVRIPLLLAPGAQDVVVPPAVAQATAARARGSSFTVLSAVGHLPSVEAPAQVAALLRRAPSPERPKEAHDE